MKKITLFLLLLLIFPITALAAEKPKVESLTAKASKNEISYEGKMEDGSIAVMCKLFNSKGEEIDLLSSSVDEKAFTGKFSNVKKGSYKVSCANYEGGEIKTVSVKITGTNNPVTYDAGIKNNVIVLVASAIGIAGAAIYLKKQKNK